MINDFLNTAAAIIEVTAAFYLVIAIAEWTFSKPSTEPALDIPECILECSEEPQPVFSLPSVPYAHKPISKALVTVVKTPRKPRAKKEKVIEITTSVKKPRSIGAKKKKSE